MAKAFLLDAFLNAVRGVHGTSSCETAELIWMHALAIGYSPDYLNENADGIRENWPRIPLPASRDALLASSALGREGAAPLDTESPVLGVTSGAIRAELKSIDLEAVNHLSVTGDTRLIDNLEI